jgi:hypothetical protein
MEAGKFILTKPQNYVHQDLNRAESSWRKERISLISQPVHVIWTSFLAVEWKQVA